MPDHDVTVEIADPNLAALLSALRAADKAERRANEVLRDALGVISEALAETLRSHLPERA